MFRGSRIIISNLSKETAVDLLQGLKEMTKGVSAKFELIDYEPDLCEREYRKVDRVRGQLAELSNSTSWGSVTKKREVLRDIKELKTFRSKCETLLVQLGEAIDKLESAANSL